MNDHGTQSPIRICREAASTQLGGRRRQRDGFSRAGCRYGPKVDQAIRADLRDAIVRPNSIVRARRARCSARSCVPIRQSARTYQANRGALKPSAPGRGASWRATTFGSTRSFQLCVTKQKTAAGASRQPFAELQASAHPRTLSRFR
jgi:hypothetical protein